MKNHLTTTFLNFLLGVLVFLSVGFTLLVIRREPEVPAATAEAVRDNNALMKVRAIINDATAYNATVNDPELTRILQATQPKTAAH